MICNVYRDDLVDAVYLTPQQLSSSHPPPPLQQLPPECSSADGTGSPGINIDIVIGIGIGIGINIDIVIGIGIGIGINIVIVIGTLAHQPSLLSIRGSNSPLLPTLPAAALF